MKKEKTPVQSDQADQQSSNSSTMTDLTSSANEFWQEFKQTKYGIFGIVLLIIFLLIIFLEPYMVAFPEAGDNWNNITYWENNPRNAAPVWVNYLTSKNLAPHKYMNKPDKWEKIDRNGMTIINGTFNYDYNYDLPPREFTFKGESKGNVTFGIEIVRPDGNKIKALQKNIQTSKESQIKISLSGELVNRTYRLIQEYVDKEEFDELSRHMIKPYRVLFSEANEKIISDPQPLQGTYKINVNAILIGEDSQIEQPRMIASGRVFGALGTDDSKRDVWSGLVAGTKWAIFIGLLTAFISVAIGVIYGVTSAYFGGLVDTAMMRVFEVFVSVPLLPVLIVLSALYKPSIWNLIFMMCLFFWTGPVRTVRSMGMQIKEETYIEAARALDASDARIVFKHMIPQLIPYAFATMALRVPMAIVYEASISLLGLGDASIVTWGQILHDAMNNGAVLKGLWWWVVPPGLIIALMGMTFAFLGFSMDKILNPKLKTR